MRHVHIGPHQQLLIRPSLDGSEEVVLIEVGFIHAQSKRFTIKISVPLQWRYYLPSGQGSLPDSRFFWTVGRVEEFVLRSRTQHSWIGFQSPENHVQGSAQCTIFAQQVTDKVWLEIDCPDTWRVKWSANHLLEALANRCSS